MALLSNIFLVTFHKNKEFIWAKEKRPAAPGQISILQELNAFLQ